MNSSFQYILIFAAWFTLVAPTCGAEDKPSPAKAPSADKPEAQPPQVTRTGITISKETTYLTEPLKRDGTVDYVAALDQEARRGVTPENNAAVLFWQAVGPDEIWKDPRETYFKKLEMTPLPEKGDYFIDFDEYISQRKNGKTWDANDTYELLESARQHPWSQGEFPLVAEWLSANEKPLALVVEASKRPRRYDPLIGKWLVAIPMPASLSYRYVVRALSVRAMKRLSEGKNDEAWEDLLTCHRLARLLSQGPTLIDVTSARWHEESACDGDTAMLQYARLSAGQIAKMRNDLNGLPPMPSYSERINVAERYTYLDNVAVCYRDGLNGLASLAKINKPYKKILTSLVYYGKGTEVDWNVSLRMGNAWFDRIADACRKPTRIERKEALRKIDEDLDKIKKNVKDVDTFKEALLEDPPKALSERLGQVVLAFFGPKSTPFASEDRTNMRFELDKLAFTLAAYRAENGSYPARLADLVPKYVAEVPKDIF
jgi:hypothetical protein